MEIVGHSIGTQNESLFTLHSIWDLHRGPPGRKRNVTIQISLLSHQTVRVPAHLELGSLFPRPWRIGVLPCKMKGRCRHDVSPQIPGLAASAFGSGPDWLRLQVVIQTTNEYSLLKSWLPRCPLDVKVSRVAERMDTTVCPAGDVELDGNNRF